MNPTQNRKNMIDCIIQENVLVLSELFKKSSRILIFPPPKKVKKIFRCFISLRTGCCCTSRELLCFRSVVLVVGPDFKAISPLNEIITWTYATFRTKSPVKGIKRLNTYTLWNHGDKRVLNACFHRPRKDVTRDESLRFRTPLTGIGSKHEKLQ